SRPRVNLAYASYALEQAALAKVQAKEYDQACQLLAAAIRHDMLLKQGTTQPPSFRLYDLLAGLSSRFVLMQYFGFLLSQAQATQQRLAGNIQRKPFDPIRALKKANAKKRKPRGLAQTKPAHPPRAHRQWKKARRLALNQAQPAKKRQALAARLAKWTAPDNAWKRRWRDTTQPLPWSPSAPKVKIKLPQKPLIRPGVLK
ncbi:MAG: hypothetical protein M3347_12515, partial [Armatimonadota bacterium]|nr:hypothetical protein [Armatimonadota bacterium]